MTEILVHHTICTTKAILENEGSTTTVTQKRAKDQVNITIRAGRLRSPTLEIAPDFQPIENTTLRPTTEAVDHTHLTNTTDTMHLRTAHKENQKVIASATHLLRRDACLKRFSHQ